MYAACAYADILVYIKKSTLLRLREWRVKSSQVGAGESSVSSPTVSRTGHIASRRGQHSSPTPSAVANMATQSAACRQVFASLFTKR